MDTEFTSYAFQELSRKQIKKYARQYDGVDMTVLLGAGEDNFPFLIRVDGESFLVMIWNSYSGIMAHLF